MQPAVETTPNIQLIEDHWPLLWVRFSGKASDAEFRRYLDRMTELLDSGRKSAHILDGRGVTQTTPQQRRMQADWIAQNREKIRRNILLTSFVIDSAIVRGALTAVLWLQNIPHNYKVVKNFNEALELATEQLRAAGLEVPDLTKLRG